MSKSPRIYPFPKELLALENIKGKSLVKSKMIFLTLNGSFQ